MSQECSPVLVQADLTLQRIATGRLQAELGPTVHKSILNLLNIKVMPLMGPRRHAAGICSFIWAQLQLCNSKQAP